MQVRFFAVCAAALATSACAGTPSEDYPSLAIRDAERWSGTMEVEPYVPPPTAPATLASVAELVAIARAAHAEFTAAAPRVRRTVSTARGSAVGTDAWASAQVAIGSLEASRIAAMVALADLDRLYVETASRGEAIARVETAQEEVSALVRQQDQVINELVAVLS